MFDLLAFPSMNGLNYTLLLLGVGGGLYGIWRSESLRRWAAVPAALVGREEVRDKAGNITEPGEPGLVHRVKTVEEAVVEFRHVVGLLTETLKRVDVLEHEKGLMTHRQEVHEAAINALIAGSLERAATAMSSAALLNAVANADLINGTTDDIFKEKP